MLRVIKCIAVSYIKMIIIDIMQKHVYTTKIVDSEVDFLSKEPLPYIFFAEDFNEFKKQRTGTASWIVNLIHFFFADCGDLSKKFADFLRGEKFPAGFSRVRGIHSHQKLIRVTK